VKKIVSIILVCLVFSLGAVDPQETAEKLLRQYPEYQAPQELADLLKQGYTNDPSFRECLYNSWRSVCSCPNGLPCFVKKEHVMLRLGGHKLAQSALEYEGLTEIVLPHKYWWSNEQTGKEYLIAEKLDPEVNKGGKCNLDGITKEQFSQLLIFAKAAVFHDFIGNHYNWWGGHKANVFMTNNQPNKEFWNKSEEDNKKERKIAVIDTKMVGALLLKKQEEKLNGEDLVKLAFDKSKCSWPSAENLKFSEFTEGNDDHILSPGFWDKYAECFKK